ncbi:FtsH protease activity modulator HflK [Sneathiella glossodoripedis]|uniref:FtsH protease activity modulator HflK n=1 Tax=Sneathiella glossodoripedis TaxID=418853 RepID=UPI00047224E3|nr:FtsH protease activity modulator HflK [Sneathiella glossodoripedis]
MPWSNQGGNGGGWQGGGGGNRGPWGQGPSGQQPPNLEDIIKKGQEKLKDTLPGGGGGKLGIFVILLVIVVGWLASGFYKVEANQQGVVLRFGEQVATTQPGLNYHLPYPIETVLTPNVTKVNSIEIGFRHNSRGGTSPVEVESLMLTGDENIVDIGVTVLWRIKDASDFLFNVAQQEMTIKAAAESAMREVIGRTELTSAITEGRLRVEQQVQQKLQDIVDTYGMGVEVSEVKLNDSGPPEVVVDAFRDVQAAVADKERAQNEALAYANDIVPRARGEAEKIRQEAEGYKQQVISEAEGEAARFLAIYNEYRKAPEVTRQRIYLETLQEVLKGKNKVIIDSEGSGQGVVPYLPLGELTKGGAK